MSIKLRTPYTISFHKLKRYAAHYSIPSNKCLIIPIKVFGNDLSCDVRWEDANGELHVRNQILFSNDNIEPLNAFKEPALHDLWRHYYPN
jgi:hypothetical protein